MAKADSQTARDRVETIRERLVREEREAREKRVAEVKAEHEAREKAAADAAARKERNAALRAKEIERLERAYVLFERALAMMDELDEAERTGLNRGTTYHHEVEKLRGSLLYNRDDAKTNLLNPEQHFRYLRIDD